MDKALTPDVLSLWHHIRADFDLWDWTLATSTAGGYCWRTRKRIDLSGYQGDVRQLLCHEVAHIFHGQHARNQHTRSFWRMVEDLVRRYLGQELDRYQLSHRSWAASY